METLIVYESMFGSTRRLAESIAEGLRDRGLRVVVSPAATAPSDVGGYGLVIVGAPTHAHTLPNAASRTQAAEWAADPGRNLELEPDALSAGVREWIDDVRTTNGTEWAAFSTRVDMPRIFAGDSAAAIARRLRRRGTEIIARSDFLVDRDSRLLPDQEERARSWAGELVGVRAHDRAGD